MQRLHFVTSKRVRESKENKLLCEGTNLLTYMPISFFSSSYC